MIDGDGVLASWPWHTCEACESAGAARAAALARQEDRMAGAEGDPLALRLVERRQIDARHFVPLSAEEVRRAVERQA